MGRQKISAVRGTTLTLMAVALLGLCAPHLALAATAARLSVAMTASPNPVQPGQPAVYSITVSNVGGTASGYFYLSMPIPGYSTASYFGASPEPSSSTCTGTSENQCLPGQVVTWYYSAGLAAGASTTFQLPVAISSSSPPPNGTTSGTTATATWYEGATKLVASASASVVIDSQRLPEVSLSDAPNPVMPGGTLSFFVNYTNPTSSAVTAGLSLKLPSGTSLVSATDKGTLSAGAVVWSLGSLPAGASGQQRVTLKVVSGVADGTLLSTTANLYNLGTLQSYAHATRVGPVETPPVTAGLLAISMSATPDPVHPGQVVSYTITVSNIGGGTSGYFYVSMPIPGYGTASYFSASPEPSSSTCTGTSANQCLPGQILTWYYSTGLAPGASATFTVPVTVDASGAPPNGTLLTTTAHIVTYSDISGGADAVQSVAVSSVPAVQLSVSDGPDLVAPGQTLTYVLNFSNPSSSAVNAGLSLSLPPGTSLVSATDKGSLAADGDVVWSLGSLPAGASGQQQVTLKVASGVAEGTLLSTTANLYNLSTLQSYARATRVSAVETPPVTAGLLAISMSATPDPVHPGQVVLYTITVSNIGGGTSGYFYVSMPIPGYSTASYFGASPVPSSSTCTGTSANQCLPGQILTWYYSTGLAPGASATFTLPVTVDASGPPPNGTLLTTTAHIVSYSDISGGASAVQSVAVGSAPAVELTVSDLPNLVAPAGTLSYVVNYSNPTSGAVTADLSLSLPPGTSLVSASAKGSQSAGAVVWSLGSLAAGTSGQQQVTLKVASGVAEGTLLSTTANLYNSSTLQSYARATRVSAVETPPVTAGLLAISMSATPDPVHPGQVVLYTITVSNIGGGTSGYFYVSMPIPGYSTASYFGASPVPSSSTCTGTSANQCLPGQILTWYYSTGLAPGASATFTLPVIVDASGPPPNGTLLTTTAHIVTYSDTSGGASAVQSVAVSSAPTEELSVSDVPNLVAPAGTLSYVVNYSNPTSGAVTANLSLSLPPGTSLVSATDQGALSADGAVVWSLGSLAAGASGQRQVTLKVASDVADGTLLSTTANLYNLSTLQSYARSTRVSAVEIPPVTAGLLAVSVNASLDPVHPGQVLSYTITVSNIGSAASGYFYVSMPIPGYSTASYFGASPVPSSSTCTGTSANQCLPGQIVTWYYSAGLAAGAKAVFKMPVDIDVSGAPPDATLLTTSTHVISYSENGGGSAVVAVVTDQ